MIGCSTIAFTPTPMWQVLLLGSHALAGVIPAQHGVTAPGDDAGHVDLEGNHQVGDQDSFPLEAGCRASFTIPVWEWPEPARHGASAPCLGAISS